MGQLDLINETKSIAYINKSMFKFIKIIGIGSIGEVWKVKYLKTGYDLAIKKVSKKKIFKTKEIKKEFEIRNLLMDMYSKDIVNLYATFQDKEFIYSVLDYLPGGDLRNIINLILNKDIPNFFNEEYLRFFAGSLINGLDYLRHKNIIHKDIKPENILLDECGYFRITDFDIACKIDSCNIRKSIGTLEYMSPERVQGNNQIGFQSDYYSLGIILYEMVMGDTPLKYLEIKFKKKPFENIIELTPKKIKENGFTTHNFSVNFCNLVNRLLEFDPNKRIGKNSITEIKEHIFFENFHFKSIYYHTLKPPFIPDFSKFPNEDIYYDENDKENDNEYNNIDLENSENQKYFESFDMIHKFKVSNIFNPSFYMQNYSEKKKENKIKMKLRVNSIQSNLNPIQNSNVFNYNKNNSKININHTQENNINLPVITQRRNNKSKTNKLNISTENNQFLSYRDKSTIPLRLSFRSTKNINKFNNHKIFINCKNKEV